MLFVLTMCLCATAATAQSPIQAVNVSQVNWLNTLSGGGALASGNAAGSSMGVNSNGDIVVSTTYGNEVLLINGQTGVETVIANWSGYNIGPVTLDSKNNLYVAGLYTNNVIKIPYVAGAYVAAPVPNLSGTPATPANCTGTDTTECNFGSNLTNGTNGYYFGITSMTFDGAGDFFFGLTNANTAPNAIFECTAACISTGTPAATLIYQEPTSATAAQLMVGGLAVDKWGDLFFTDSLYNGGKNESVSSNLNELAVSAGAGFGGATTGFAAAPTVLYTETIAVPAAYDDELDGVAVDHVSGTVYFADQYNGIFAYPNAAGTVDTTTMYTVSTQGSKLLALDAKNNVYGASYSTVISSGGADTVFQALVNNVKFPSTTAIGSSATTSFNETANIGTPPVATVVTGSYVTVADNATTCSATPSLTVTVTGADSAEFTAGDTTIVPPATALLDTECSMTMSGAAAYPDTVTFTPTAGGTQTAAITASDASSNSGTVTVTGAGPALIAQTITFTAPASPVAFGVAPISLDATGGASGKPVVFTVDASSTAGAGTISGSKLTITGLGTIVIDANQAASGAYSAAAQVQQSVVVTQGTQTIDFTAPTSPVTIGVAPITLTATGGASGMPVVFSIDASSTPGAGTLSGSKLTVNTVGTIVIDANQAGDTDYAAAPQAQQTIKVNPVVTIPAGAKIIMSQVNWLNNLAGGGALASGNAAGSSMGVNSNGDIVVSNTYGNEVLLINGQTGVETVIANWSGYNIGPVALDSKNNLYVGGLYTNNVIKIPYVAGAYVAAPLPNLSGTPATPANCTGTDTAECNFGSNLTNGTNGYYFGITSMTFDAAGDFFFGLTNANTAPNAIFECTAACISTGTPAATLIYQEPTSATAAQLMVGGLAVDKWGDLFFTDSLYNGGKNESISSDINELQVSAGAGFGGATTGFAAAPIVLYTETIASPGAYDDELDGVAVDAVSGTVYFADQYNGVYAFPNAAGTVNSADMYTVSTQGSKLLALDAKDNLYGASYSTVITSGGADTVFQALVNSVVIPGTIQVGTSASTSFNTTANIGTPPVATVVTGSYVTVLDNVTTCTADPSVTVTASGADSAEFAAVDTIIVAPATALLDLECSATASGGASYPVTVTFKPTAGGAQTATLTSTDSASNSGTAKVSGVGQALIAQTITFAPTTPVVFGVAPIALTATGGASGNPVTFTLVSGPATLSGSTLTITGAGSVVVAANQAGSATYLAAPQVEATIVVDQAPQTIVFAPTTPVTFTTTPITLTATGGASGNPVTFSVTSGPATLSGDKLTLTGLGSVVVAASQAGTANYSAATTVSATIVVNPIGTVATPTFTPATGSTIFTNGADTVTLATTSTGASIYYTLTSGATGTTPTSGSTLYTSAGIPLKTVGTYTIEAIALEADYTSSAVATATYTVSAIPPSFTMAISPASISIQAGLSGAATVSITPVGGFNSAITFSCSGLPVGAECAFTPSSVTPNGTAVATTTVYVNTSVNNAAVHHNSNPLFPGTTLAVALCFLGWKKRRHMQLFLMLAISVLGLTLFTGCGGNNNFTPTTPTTSIVTVTGTSGTLTEKATLSVTVN